MWYIYATIGIASALFGWLASNLWFNWRNKERKVVSYDKEYYSAMQHLIDNVLDELEDVISEEDLKDIKDREEYEDMLDEFYRKLGDKDD